MSSPARSPLSPALVAAAQSILTTAAGLVAEVATHATSATRRRAARAAEAGIRALAAKPVNLFRPRR